MSGKLTACPRGWKRLGQSYTATWKARNAADEFAMAHPEFIVTVCQESGRFTVAYQSRKELGIHMNPGTRDIGSTVSSYHSAATFLGRKERRKLANNTYVNRMDAETIAVRLHHTDVVTYSVDGTTTLRSGGYRSVTTKQRIKQLLPGGWTIYQKDYEWYVVAPDGSEEKFFDGMIITTGTTSGKYGANPKKRGDRLTTPEKHQLKIAIATLRMPHAMAGVMGGMTKEEARVIVARLTSKMMDEPESPGHMPNPGPPTEMVPWVDVWEERDNLQITLYYGIRNDANESREIATWTDEDAREMFTDGFFKSGKALEDSVIGYAQEMGMLKQWWDDR